VLSAWPAWLACCCIVASFSCTRQPPDLGGPVSRVHRPQAWRPSVIRSGVCTGGRRWAAGGPIFAVSPGRLGPWPFALAWLAVACLVLAKFRGVGSNGTVPSFFYSPGIRDREDKHTCVHICLGDKACGL
jgi:hypothetical protein